MVFSLSEGEFLVKSARKVIEQYLREKKTVKLDAGDKFKKKLGVFVTLETFPARELRGCIGYPYPTEPLINALASSAVSAAVHDPRFPGITEEELKKIVIEVTVLTEPRPVQVTDRKEMPGEITIGKHGLIIEYGPFSGLLLPQVAVEYKWSAEEFLSQVCWKAGLSPDMWLDKNSRVFSFEGQLFAEESPGGKVVEKGI
jgi:uncharacterized protein (TIGR00296 family)